MSALRGEVWLIDFGDPVGREQVRQRPGVVISVDALNESRAGVIIVVPTTTRHRGLPSHIELDPASSGLSAISYAKCEDIKSISEERLIARLGLIGQEPLFETGGGAKVLV
ncbi:type II toxin-antitoxin system PemK/MazF family toxin [Ferrimicrobium sp.]|uniref:type II toxin-antitoxin system PemK/MazF family toxin n=1 Tax=Ferrimicrobium sp. TaxID=2926050 RepID=UPI00344F0D7F